MMTSKEASCNFERASVTEEAVSMQNGPSSERMVLDTSIGSTRHRRRAKPEFQLQVSLGSTNFVSFLDFNLHYCAQKNLCIKKPTNK